MHSQAYLKPLWNIFNKYKYVLLIAGIGIVLLCWPSSKTKKSENTAAVDTRQQEQTVEGVEAKLENLLSMIEGAGNVRVMLTLASGPEAIYADEKTLSSDSGSDTNGKKTQSQTKYVIVKDSGGNETLVELKRLCSKYRGALIVCQGAENASVRLDVTNAVRTLTGLGTDCITVVKME